MSNLIKSWIGCPQLSKKNVHIIVFEIEVRRSLKSFVLIVVSSAKDLSNELQINVESIQLVAIYLIIKSNFYLFIFQSLARS
jgi:hypothetical protein